MPVYNFNPWQGADHNRRRYLGSHGKCSVFLGTQAEDPKYKGPCGPQYTDYRACLKAYQFDRQACRAALQAVSQCEREKLSDQSAQLNILRNWRKNKGVPVKSSFTPLKIFDQGPVCLDDNKS